MHLCDWSPLIIEHALHGSSSDFKHPNNYWQKERKKEKPENPNSYHLADEITQFFVFKQVRSIYISTNHKEIFCITYLN